MNQTYSFYTKRKVKFCQIKSSQLRLIEKQNHEKIAPFKSRSASLYLKFDF